MVSSTIIVVRTLVWVGCDNLKELERLHGLSRGPPTLERFCHGAFVLDRTLKREKNTYFCPAEIKRARDYSTVIFGRLGLLLDCRYSTVARTAFMTQPVFATVVIVRGSCHQI